jgi:hypothetical protein
MGGWAGLDDLDIAGSKGCFSDIGRTLDPEDDIEDAIDG